MWSLRPSSRHGVMVKANVDFMIPGTIETKGIGSLVASV